MGSGAAVPTRVVSRQHAGSTADTTFAPLVEVRRIVWAQGIQFTNADFAAKIARFEAGALDEALKKDLKAQGKRVTDERVAALRDYHLTKLKGSSVPRGLLDEYPDLTILGDRRALWFSAKQSVLFDIEVITTKDAFKKALETPGLHVVYAGHARYGRGPCFGPSQDPGDDWENGTTPAITGLFRMGYPFIGVPVAEIVDHGYTANPVLGSEPRPDASQCDPDARHAKFQRFTLIELAQHPLKSPPVYLIDPMMLSALIPAAAVPGATFWGYDSFAHGHMSRHVVLHAGWEATASAPFDLGATDMRCRVFCHLGCSSYKHNYPVVRKLKKWTREGDDRFAYWTTNISSSNFTYWLRKILGYPERNDHKDWGPSIRWAVAKVNSDLRRAGETFQVI